MEQWNNHCPVCDHIQFLQDHDICPQCGTEFGYDDLMLTHAQLREAWIKDGSKWWSETTLPAKKLNGEE